MLLETNSTSPVLSVVIAAWNSWRFLPDCLEAIQTENSLHREIIVVDNGSSDGTVAHLREHYPEVLVVRNATNEGHSRAINRGLRLARGTYVLILDADTIASPGVAMQLVEFLDGRPEVVIAAPKMLNGDGTIQETARSFPKPINALFGRQTVLSRLFPSNRFSLEYVGRKNADTEEPYEVDWVSSACLTFRRGLVERVGFWDQGFRGYWVEADWCKQAHAAGKIYCVPRARVTHFYQNRAGKKKGVRRIIDFHYGAHRFYWKHYTRGLLDPRSIVAAAALALRAAPLIVADWLRQPKEEKAPASTYKLSRPSTGHADGH